MTDLAVLESSLVGPDGAAEDGPDAGGVVLRRDHVPLAQLVQRGQVLLVHYLEKGNMHSEYGRIS